MARIANGLTIDKTSARAKYIIEKEVSTIMAANAHQKERI
jgi:hypothetical protein